MKKREFVQRMLEALSSGERHNKTSVEKLALSFGIPDKTLVKELTELAIVHRARDLAHSPGTQKQRFDKIVELYHNQVNLSHRTSQSILLQQYSTPAPIGYLAGLYCRLPEASPDKKFFEPSAGNGLLTIAGNPSQFYVNEIDDVRRSNLLTQGFKKVTSKDATQDIYESWTFDAVLTNPPFGKVDKPVKSVDYTFNVLDHIMCVRALHTLKFNGRSALIIGGHTTWDSKGRIQAGKNMNFLSYLYKYYYVDDIINIDGKKLYSRQGTAFDVRLILISGRKNYSGGYPPLYNEKTDHKISDFNSLYSRVMKENKPGLLELEAEALEIELQLLKF